MFASLKKKVQIEDPHFISTPQNTSVETKEQTASIHHKLALTHSSTGQIKKTQHSNNDETKITLPEESVPTDFIEVKKLSVSYLQQVNDIQDDISTTINSLENTLDENKIDIVCVFCKQNIEERQRTEQSLKELETKFKKSEVTNQLLSQDVLSMKLVIKDFETSIQLLKKDCTDLKTEKSALILEIDHLKDLLFSENISLQNLTKSSLEKDEQIVNLHSQLDQEKNAMQELTIKLEEFESHEALVRKDEEEQKQLLASINQLESQMSDKIKIIKKQEQRINDFKKMLQKEINSKAAQPTIHSALHPHIKNKQTDTELTDIVVGSNSEGANTFLDKRLSGTKKINESIQLNELNFKYLRHVILKFMLCREAEAIQLIKAVSMLLNFSSDEERMLRETIEGRMSWFGGTRPQLSQIAQPFKINS